MFQSSLFLIRQSKNSLFNRRIYNFFSLSFTHQQHHSEPAPNHLLVLIQGGEKNVRRKAEVRRREPQHQQRQFRRRSERSSCSRSRGAGREEAAHTSTAAAEESIQTVQQNSSQAVVQRQKVISSPTRLGVKDGLQAAAFFSPSLILPDSSEDFIHSAGSSAAGVYSLTRAILWAIIRLIS